MTSSDLATARASLHAARLKESDMDAWARRWGRRLIQRIEELEVDMERERAAAKKRRKRQPEKETSHAE